MTRRADKPDQATSAALARLYDQDLAEDPGDLDLYLALARRTGGPILELAVGTGRLAVPLAAAGHAVTGVDRDPEMLARARDRAASDLAPSGTAGPGSTGTLELIEAEVAGLSLPSAGSFRFAFIALSSLLVMDSRAAQRAAVEALARHLAPGGVAAIDVWVPAADDLARYDGRLALEHVRTDSTTGRLVMKASSAQHDAPRQMVTLTTLYEEGAQGQAATRWVRTDRLRLISGDELAGLVEDAGLVVEQLAGGYDLEPLGPASERAIVIAIRP